MAHQSHAPDTTFIVSEPDFVFYKEDGEEYLSYLSKEEAETQTLTRWEEMAEKLSPEAAKDFRRELRVYLEAVKKDKNAPWPKERPLVESDDDEVATSRWTSELVDTGNGVVEAFSRPQKPAASGFRPKDISDHLHDLQALMTAAARMGRDGFLWLGWNACQWQSGYKKKGVRTTCPASGAQLTMITSACARKLLPKWRQERDTHMGTFFSQKLGLLWQEFLGAAYVYPPIGGFFTHKSTTCSTEKCERVLRDHFDHSWSQAGTRKEAKWQQHRWICGFTERGSAKWLGRGAVKLPAMLEPLRWKTQAPPGTPASSCGWRYYHEGLPVSDQPQTQERRRARAG